MNIKFFNYQISEFLPPLDLNDKIVVNTINAHSFITALNDKIFNRALKKSDILTPDGAGITLALKFFKKIAINKVAGWDIHEYYLKNAQENQLKVFYMGAKIIHYIKLRKK